MTVADDDDDLERKALANLREIVGIKESIAEFVAKRQMLEAPVRAWLDAHPGERLFDGEHGVEAYHELSQKAGGYDVAAMPRMLVLHLHQANALSVDAAMLKALEGKSVLPIDAKRYYIPGGEGKSLQVKAVKR